MARHIWLTKTFDPAGVIVTAGFDALRIAQQHGLPYEATCRFIGYIAENLRQSGVSRESFQPKYAWEGVVKSKHRYARGKNAENYRVAGEGIIAAMANRVGLDGAPSQIVWDYLAEHPETELVSEKQMRKELERV